MIPGTLWISRDHARRWSEVLEFPAIERWHSAYPRLDRYLEARFERQISIPRVFGTFVEVLRRRHPPEDGVEQPR